MSVRAAIRRPFVVACGTLLVLGILYAQARNPLWAQHLGSDVGVFNLRAVMFLNTGSWSALEENEYQPGALFFFLFPALLERVGLSYLHAFFFLSAFLIGAHVVVLFRRGGPSAAWAALLLFLAAGPIVLYRFELLASVLVLLALVRLPRSVVGSGTLLGLGTAVKVYPVVLLPMFLLAAPRSVRRASAILAGFLLGLGIVLLAFLATGGAFDQLWTSLSYHTRKPVALFSPFGVAILLQGLVRDGSLPQLLNTYGMHGFAGGTIVRMLSTAGLLGSLLLAVNVARRTVTATRVTLPIIASRLAVLSIVMWPTGFQPQYLLWPLAFSALLVSDRSVSRWRAWSIVVLHALTLVVMQVLYPVRFSTLLEMLSGQAPVNGGLLAFVALGAVFLIALFVEVFGLAWRFQGGSLHARRM